MKYSKRGINEERIIGETLGKSLLYILRIQTPNPGKRAGFFILYINTEDEESITKGTVMNSKI